MNSTKFIHSTSRAAQTLGIFGVAGLPDRRSCEITVLPSRTARAITNVGVDTVFASRDQAGKLRHHSAHGLLLRPVEFYEKRLLGLRPFQQLVFDPLQFHHDHAAGAHLAVADQCLESLPQRREVCSR